MKVLTPHDAIFAKFPTGIILGEVYTEAIP